MKTLYVVMSSYSSPVAFYLPTPKAVFSNLKLAKQFCKEHNENRRTSNEYYICKAENKQ